MTDRLEIRFTLNGEPVSAEVRPATPAAELLREEFELKGTKVGCGEGECGACTVLLNGQPIRSCQCAVAGVGGGEITTIEGLSPDGGHPVQQAWVEEQVPQCGYCQSGQIMSAVALLATSERPTDAEIDSAMSGNVCRCGTYGAIRRASHRAAELVADPEADDPGAGGVPACPSYTSHAADEGDT